MAPTEIPADMPQLPLSPDDAEALVGLVAEAGWNQIAADWRFMLQQGRGIGVRDPQGDWVGSALAFPLGPRLAWISMVLTAQRWRRRGIGHALLAQSIAAARSGGGAVGLDATEFGRPVYLKSGFRDLYAIRRWRIPGRPAAIEPPENVAIRQIQPTDLDALARFDVARSAMWRDHVLQHLQSRAPVLAHIALDGEMPVGFVLGRDGRNATHIGPVVADSSAIAQALATRAMAEIGPPYLMDIPEPQGDIAQWLAAADAHSPRSYVRMVMGDAPGLEDASHVFALAGPELG